jgi:hypothetical protein
MVDRVIPILTQERHRVADLVTRETIEPAK